MKRMTGHEADADVVLPDYCVTQVMQSILCHGNMTLVTLETIFNGTVLLGHYDGIHI